MICRVGLIYFPDQQRALAGIRRALRDGGRVAAIVYSTPPRNEFFSIPVSIIRDRAQLPPPEPGQPGPFSLGGPAALQEALTTAGFSDVTVDAVPAPLRLPSAADCVGFERESFGALHQMLAGVPASERPAVWDEIEAALTRFETPARRPAAWRARSELEGRRGRGPGRAGVPGSRTRPSTRRLDW